MQVPVTHISALTYIERLRLLPSNGKVLVRPGQKVNATDIVAEGWEAGQHLLVDVRRALGISSVEQASKLIVPKEGDHLASGGVIAESKGLFSKTVRSPAEAEVVAIQNGQVLLELTGLPLKLAAGFTGTVKEVVNGRGAVIEVHGALIQGAWGNDQFNQGMLLGLVQNPGDELTNQRLDVSMRGAIVFGGPCSDPAVLRSAEEMPLRGLIVSSLTPELLPQAERMTIPVAAIEGIGKFPYSSAAYKILTTSEKRDACLKASKRDPFTGERPEVILPLPAIGEQPEEAVEIKPGQTVRIIGAPAGGQIGVVVSLLPGRTAMPSGLIVPAAAVRLESNEVIAIPLVNLDVIA